MRTVATMFDLRALGSDACRWDSSASCRYWHMKCRAMAGEALTAEELRFVGFTEERPRVRDGWQDAATNLGVIYFHGDRYELSPEDSTMFAALMSVDNVELPAAHALEFLGG
jgi:hypothetical protein